MTTLFRIVGGPFLAFVDYFLAPRATYALFDMSEFDMSEDMDDVGARAGYPDR
ncbi:hypothetical protein [Rhodococcus opacus]|uniref:hypothetical protein n=1 Tax=Rhodococcus opacus TaxID=37919 RepID=UPI001300A5C7|nr:hypothetical protein [Rhodococcus opacus]